MPPWLRALLMIVGVGVLILVIAVVFGLRYISTHKDELMKNAREEKAAGQKAGEGQPPSACIDAALQRVRANDSFSANLRTRFFVDSCLKAATPSPDTCAQVPTGIIDFAKWAAGECNRRGMASSQGCTQVFTALRDYCHPH